MTREQAFLLSCFLDNNIEKLCPQLCAEAVAMRKYAFGNCGFFLLLEAQLFKASAQIPNASKVGIVNREFPRKLKRDGKKTEKKINKIFSPLSIKILHVKLFNQNFQG